MQRTYHLFAGIGTRLDSDLVDRLGAIGIRRRFAKSAAVQFRGTSGDGFWLIMSGAVTLMRFGADGETTIYGVLGPGDLFGELAFFAGIARQVDAVAVEDAELVWINREVSDRLLRDEPGFARVLLASLANQLRLALDRIEADAHRTAAQRIAATLADLASPGEGSVRTTQQQLADLVGVSRVTAGTVLSRLAAAGLIARGYGYIEVPDRRLLQVFAETSGS
ncbi:Crp/Fnr family transcriptional regulator [Novosphingobium sp.]|uniref:Crp/Fnr family transcriptional regulator n=1 Tax=Novosphingobium sp. TaxID=1874826 RepID=UPI0025DA432E|nr:Crp/Fnr family transcriptional regulator [Novosphingobium sp.]